MEGLKVWPCSLLKFPWLSIHTEIFWDTQIEWLKVIAWDKWECLKYNYFWSPIVLAVLTAWYFVCQASVFALLLYLTSLPQRLIRLCGEVKAAPSENEEIQFLCVVCAKLRQDPYLVNFFLEVGYCMLCWLWYIVYLFVYVCLQCEPITFDVIQSHLH